MTLQRADSLRLGVAGLARSPQSILVAVSGHFDPPTPGHLDYFEAAKKLGDYLVVIMNNDQQLLAKRKGTRLEGRVRYPQDDRLRLLSALRIVDMVVLCIDTDGSVAKTLLLIKPLVFARGAGKVIVNLPANEALACEQIGCEIISGVGGEKTHSSSYYNWED